MTALAATMVAQPGTGLDAGYAAHVAALNIGADASELRLRCARAFLAVHPDLEAWMARPFADRHVDISRAGAWPLVYWAVLTRRVVPDLELLVGRHQGGMHVLAERLFADGYTAVRAAAGRLGWTPRWVEAVVVGPLTLAVAVTGRAPQELTDVDLDTVAANITATMATSAAHRARLVRD